MLSAITRFTFSVLAGSELLKMGASRVGMRSPRSPARRFVAGESSDDAIRVAEALESQGLRVTLDLLGEKVTSSESAIDAARTYVRLIEAAHTAGADRGVSVKLTQIGLDIDPATAIDNLRRIVDAAVEPGFFVRVDMEGSAYTADTLSAVEALWSLGYRNVGVAIQSALRRSADDVARLNDLGVSVRLVKGAYREPRSVAFTRKEDVDDAFRKLAGQLLVAGNTPAIATHDPALIDYVRQTARERGIGQDRFEFEFLYGIRRDIQLSLVREGYRVRVYVPYGREWFPYFMRRLGERPANVWFVVKNLFAERDDRT
jgi:proline dehydrogenase